jgi:hypothetical protein
MEKMDKLISRIEQLHGLRFSGGVSSEDISNAETLLNLTFAEDYKLYLSKFGQVEAEGIELSGLSNKRLTSVVILTQSERKMLKIPPKHYVIENIGIDGLIYTQDATGAVFQLLPNRPITKVADNLLQYIESINKK